MFAYEADSAVPRPILACGGSGGTHDQWSFQDLSEWSEGAQEPLTLHWQQHVRPGGTERRRKKFSDAHDCHAAGSRLRHHQPRRHRRAAPERPSAPHPRLPAAGVRRVSQDLRARHAPSPRGHEGDDLLVASARKPSTHCCSRPICGTLARKPSPLIPAA